MPAPILRLSRFADIEPSDVRLVIRVPADSADHATIAELFAGGGKCRLFHANSLALIQLVELKIEGDTAEWYAVI